MSTLTKVLHACTVLCTVSEVTFWRDINIRAVAEAVEADCAELDEEAADEEAAAAAEADDRVLDAAQTNPQRVELWDIHIMCTRRLEVNEVVATMLNEFD